MRVLIVEDDADVADALVRMFRREGHGADWEPNGEGAQETLRIQSFDLIILDIGLPGASGLHVLRAIRFANLPTPVLMLTARGDVSDKIAALDAGADDYMPKPFDIDELMARCRALLRRRQGSSSNVTIIGDLVFDRGSKTVRIGNTRISLPRREFRLLEIFLGNLGRAMSKEQLLSKLFDFDDEVGEKVLSEQMHLSLGLAV